MEQDVLQLLRQSHGQAFSVKEVSKIVDRKEFREDPSWARHILSQLCSRGLIEKDADGRYYVPDEFSP